jgi:CheY-like chemotaxis protein
MDKDAKFQQLNKHGNKENIMSASRRVLVVDDDPIVAKSFNRVLTSKGYAVIAAQNGEDALKKLSAEKYDLVFTDIKMPGMSGMEVAERVKASQPWLPVVIITGYGTQADQARAEAAGISSFLNKPLSPEMIESSARQALATQYITAAPGAVQATAVPEAAASSAESRAKNIALFLAAPFIGLAYILAAPFVGLAALAWFASKALAARARMSENTKRLVLAITAPVIGLAFIVALPVAGIGALTWFGGKALYTKVSKSERAQRIILTVSAPFIGLAFILTMPIVGLGALAWIGTRAMFKD